MCRVLHPASESLYDPDTLVPLLVLIGAMGFLIFFFVSFTAGAVSLGAGSVVVLAITYSRSRMKWRGSDAWPVTEGRVESVDVRAFDEEYIGELVYSYSVQEYYSGFCRCVFRTERQAWEFVDGFRGRTIPVRYKPENHGISLVTEAELSAGNSIIR
jgi:hypothetical protein